MRNSKSYPREVEMIPSCWMILPFLFSHLSYLSSVIKGMYRIIYSIFEPFLPCQILPNLLRKEICGKSTTPLALKIHVLITRRPWLGIISRWRYWKILHWRFGSTHFTMSTSNVTSTDMTVSAASWPCFKDFVQVYQVLILFGSFLVVDVFCPARSWTWLLPTRPFITLKQANWASSSDRINTMLVTFFRNLKERRTNLLASSEQYVL